MLTQEQLSRRKLLVGLPACALATLLVENAFGGAAYPIPLSELVMGSGWILVATPKNASSHWAGQGHSRRIVTMTRIDVLQSLDGRPPKDSQLVVRTLGGKVGDIGQIVHGEAELERDRPSVLFLREAEAGALAITGMAQGHFPLKDDDAGTPRLETSPRLSDFITKDPHCAVARLRGRTLATCEELVLEVLDGK